MATDDVRLVRRCLKGEPDAMRALVESFQDQVFGLCVRLLQDRHEAEDVTQEVFLRVFRSLKRWDPSRPLRPWIIAIAVNRCRTFMGQRSRRPELIAHLQELPSETAEDHTPELVREIRLAMAELRPEYRSVFALFHEQGLAYELIAEALNHPVGTIKTWLHRARLQVLDRLRRRGMVAEIEHELP